MSELSKLSFQYAFLISFLFACFVGLGISFCWWFFPPPPLFGWVSGGVLRFWGFFFGLVGFCLVGFVFIKGKKNPNKMYQLFSAVK